MFYIALISFYFVGYKMFKFYHFLLARYDHSKWFQKLFLNILSRFGKLNVMESGAYFLIEL